MSEQITEPLAMAQADPDCTECHGLGTVRRFIGHEGRGALWPCNCIGRIKPLGHDDAEFGMKP